MTHGLSVQIHSQSAFAHTGVGNGWIERLKKNTYKL